MPGTYNVTINGTATGAVAQSRTLTFTITAGTAPVIASQPSDITVCSGNNASFTVLVNEGTYQWQVSTNGGTTFSNISGATNATYTVSNASAIEYDADMAMAIHRYPNTNMIEIVSRKNRHGHEFDFYLDWDINLAVS